MAFFAFCFDFLISLATKKKRRAKSAYVCTPYIRSQYELQPNPGDGIRKNKMKHRSQTNLEKKRESTTVLIRTLKCFVREYAREHPEQTCGLADPQTAEARAADRKKTKCKNKKRKTNDSPTGGVAFSPGLHVMGI